MIRWHLLNRFLFATAISLSGSLKADPVTNFWFAGAEINRYELSQSHYGQAYPGHAEFIFVTEPFLTDAQVKREFGQGPSTDVLKLNALRTFNTGIYSYRLMTSTFRSIDQATYPKTLKSTTSIQDWCGQAFQQINWKENGWAVEIRSYFQKAADQDFALPEGILEDGLWLQVRLAPEKLPIGKLLVIPGAVDTRFTHRPIKAEVAVGTLNSKDDITVYTLNYPQLERTLTIQFDTAFPHIIQAWSEKDRSGTTTALLKDRIMNSEYWSQNRPEDSRLRKKLGLSPIAD